jgi:hypothetical protein
MIWIVIHGQELWIPIEFETKSNTIITRGGK